MPLSTCPSESDAAPREPRIPDDALITAVMHPFTLGFLASSVRDLANLGLSCRSFGCFVFGAGEDAGDECFHRENVLKALCAATCHQYGAYVALQKDADMPWGTFFADKVWPERLNKWREQPPVPLDVAVSVRFRPGTKETASVLLPLHQKLLLMKKGETLMPNEPDEYKDALMGTTMVDPVRLPSSGKVCDRRIIEMHLKRQRTDPFTRRRLTVEDLIPLEDLRVQIAAWRQGTAVPASERDGIRVDENGMQKVLQTISKEVSGDLLDAIVEAEKLKTLGKSCAASNPAAQHHTHRTPDTPPEISPAGTGDLSNTQPTTATAQPFAAVSSAPANPSQAWNIPMRGFWNTPKPAPVREVARSADKPKVLEVRENHVAFFQPGNGVRQFAFQRCFPAEHPANSNADVYETVAQPLVENALSGRSSCVMCYGQTSSGKTHTMFGTLGDKGVAQRAMDEVLRAKKVLSGVVDLRVTARYLQVYNEQLTCLLTSEKVTYLFTEDSFRGGEAMPVEDENDMDELLERGERNKVFAITNMSDRSSRSHSVLMLSIDQTFVGAGVVERQTVRSVLNLIDLAGSERVGKSGATGATLVEAQNINSSLLTLSKCITNRQQSHVPYRNSKLTSILRTSISGSCSTSLVICCRSDDAHASETVQSLVFAARCSSITDKAATSASSPAAALALIDHSLALSKESLSKLGSDSLQYRVLAAQHEKLLKKRASVALRAEAP